jgi:hypothetical protein
MPDPLVTLTGCVAVVAAAASLLGQAVAIECVPDGADSISADLTPEVKKWFNSPSPDPNLVNHPLKRVYRNRLGKLEASVDPAVILDSNAYARVRGAFVPGDGGRLAWMAGHSLT